MPEHTPEERERVQTPAEKAKVAAVMQEFEAGTLRSSSGEKVTSRDQALAIALEESRKVKDNPGHNSDHGGAVADSLEDVRRRSMRQGQR